MGRDSLYTIGYQGAGLAAFIACLSAGGVRTLADIRYAPFSRRAAFRQGPLRASIEQAGIQYIHLRDLGNPPESRAAARAGDLARYGALFRAHLDTDAARTALRKVQSLLDTGPVCLMCLERLPQDCHRLMVAERLAAMRGLLVEHLLVGDPGADRQKSLL
jgi:uncharacterized protein (DUF488 family)